MAVRRPLPETLMTPDAPQHDHDLREVLNGLCWIVGTGSP